MTFFEQELRKTVGAIYPDAKYIGRAAYVDLGGENRAKFEFVTLGHADHYEAIQASILNQNSGAVDSIRPRFAELFSSKKLPLDQAPHAWSNCGKTEWYGFKPTEADYDHLITEISDYTELFEVQSPMMQQEQMM